MSTITLEKINIKTQQPLLPPSSAKKISTVFQGQLPSLSSSTHSLNGPPLPLLPPPTRRFGPTQNPPVTSLPLLALPPPAAAETVMKEFTL